MDPIALALASAALGGAAGEGTKAILKAGHVWFRRYSSDYAPAAKHAADENIAAFMAGLAVRLERLEHRTENDTKVTAQIEALAHPDFAAILGSAIHAAMRTDDPLKHASLGRLVADRLTSMADSSEAAAGNLAVEAVARLSRSQIHLLGVLAVLLSVRPEGLPLEQQPLVKEPDVSGVTPAERAAIAEFGRWLQVLLGAGDAIQVTEAEIMHMTSALVLVLDYSIARDLAAVLNLTSHRPLPEAVSNQLHEPIYDVVYRTERGVAFEDAWNTGLRYVNLTPAGALIGVAAAGHMLSVEISFNISQLEPPPRVRPGERGEIGRLDPVVLSAERPRFRLDRDAIDQIERELHSRDLDRRRARGLQTRD